MKLKARGPHASRTARACPRAAPLLGAPGRRGEGASGSFHLAGHVFALCPGQRLTKGSVTHVVVTSRLPQCAINSDLNVTIQSRLRKAAAGVGPLMTLGGLLPRGKAEGRGGGERLTRRGVRQRASCLPLAGLQHIGTSSRKQNRCYKSFFQAPADSTWSLQGGRCTWERSDTLRQRPFSWDLGTPERLNPPTRGAAKSPRALCPSHQHQLPADPLPGLAGKSRASAHPALSSPEHQAPGAPHALPAAAVLPRGPVNAVPTLGLARREIRYELYWKGMGRKCQQETSSIQVVQNSSPS